MIRKAARSSSRSVRREAPVDLKGALSGLGKLYNTEAATRVLTLQSPVTLRRWRAAGRGPRYFRLGSRRGRVVYAERDLLNFLEERREVSNLGGAE